APQRNDPAQPQSITRHRRRTHRHQGDDDGKDGICRKRRRTRMPGHSLTHKTLKSTRRIAALFFLIVSSPLLAEAGYPVDLNSLPVYVRAGFALEDGSIPSPDEEIGDDFLRLPAARNRPVIVPDLKLPGMPEREFPELRSLPPVDFTLLWRFTLTDEDLT